MFSYFSRNKLDFLGHKMEANLKGKMDPKLTDGKMNGEFDIHLPNDHYLAGKLDRELHVVNDVGNGNAHLTLEHRPKKSGPAHKLDIKAHAKDTSFKNKVFDLTYNIVAENLEGKHLKADLICKHNHEGEKHNSVYKVR